MGVVVTDEEALLNSALTPTAALLLDSMDRLEWAQEQWRKYDEEQGRENS